MINKLKLDFIAKEFTLVPVKKESVECKPHEVQYIDRKNYVQLFFSHLNDPKQIYNYLIINGYRVNQRINENFENHLLVFK